MTTYHTSRSTRPVPVVPGHIGLPTDAYVISQPIIPPEVVAAYTPSVDTLDGGLSWTGVIHALEEAPQSHAERRTGAGGGSGWAVACVFAGLVLIGLSLFLGFVVLPLRHMP